MAGKQRRDDGDDSQAQRRKKIGSKVKSRGG